ncbi:MAG: redoxin domain-containing protein [Verrucomicrobiota bacterium]
MNSKPWVVSGVVILLIMLITLGGLATRAADTPRPTLSGAIVDAAGKPLSNAAIFIYTAAPKVGAGVLCPSCYADCRKQTTSDTAGQFTIPSLDPELRFQILVVAKDHQPKFVDKVDPAEKPIKVTLKPRTGGETSDKRLAGRVTDSDGKPVASAVVNIRGVTRSESTQYGGNKDIDPLAVTDERGDFVINGQTAFEAAGVDVVARGFAKGIFHSLATGGKIHELKLAEGASLTGRVTKDGKPVAGVEVGVSGADRSSEVYVGNFSVATDADGRFLFVNLPAKTSYQLYGLMKSLGPPGSIPAQVVRTGDNGDTFNAGELTVKPGFTVAGEIRLKDGTPVPADTRVLLSRENAWDSQQTTAAANGQFRFENVPAESVGLSTRIKGYQMSPRNGSIDPLNPYHLIGRVHTNKLDLIVEFVPGEKAERLEGDQTSLREEPLRGVEAAPVGGDIKVTGKAVDADTQQPLAAFTVTPGRRSRYGEQTDWLSSRQTEHSNGMFTVYFNKQPQAPAVLIEAEGYLPQASGWLDSTSETNLIVALKKGSGYGGIVHQPDGAPATNLTVYLTDNKNGVYVDGDKMAVRENIYQGTKKTTTDSSGRFSFKPMAGAHSVIVVNEMGYAEVLVDQLGSAGKIRLQAPARIEGQLFIGPRPGTNETVRLGLAHIPYVSHPRNFPALSFFATTRTDVEGRFVFERIPPIAVEVYHEPKVRDSKMGTIAQAQTTKLLVKPGETHKLTLGGQGRSVIGRLEVTGYDGTINWRQDVFSLETVVPQPSVIPDLRAITKAFSAKMGALDTDAEKLAAQKDYEQQQQSAQDQLRAFYRTEAGREHFFKNRRFALNFAPDGSFRVEDVPGGKYNLRIDLREGGDDFNRFNSPAIANLQKEVEVPDSPGGRSDEPYDLGTIKLTARTVMKAGKVAPEFSVKTIDDQPLKLSDFKGKYVLLDFWATWCGPCVAETPNLKATWEAFKDDPRFTMMALSLDSDAAAPRKYAQKHQLGWAQGFLGDWSATDLPAQFGVQGIPAIFLIGPDGKIVETGLRGDNIKQAVAKALSKN